MFERGILLLSLVSATFLGFCSIAESNPKPEALTEVNKEVNEEILNKTYEFKLQEAKKVDDRVKEIAKGVHFNPSNVTEKSNLTYTQISKMLEGTNLQPLARHYLELEQTYGINALFVMSLTAEESGWGTSNVALNNNNISGQRINEVYRTFPSWKDCLTETFRLISEDYVNPEGKYYVGSSDIYDINSVYCPDTEKDSWANNIQAIAQNLKDKLQEV